jgi:hypothetical protein
MPFPFLPAGAVLAAVVLVGALTVFGLILRAMDRAFAGLRDNLLSGLVSGIRTWGRAGPDRLVNISSGASSGSLWGGSDGTPPGHAWTTSSSTRGAEAVPAPELIDLGSRPIEPTPDHLR